MCGEWLPSERYGGRRERERGREREGERKGEGGRRERERERKGEGGREGERERYHDYPPCSVPEMGTPVDDMGTPVDVGYVVKRIYAGGDQSFAAVIISDSEVIVT